jgi:uracil-DNA glycosylase family 4
VDANQETRSNPFGMDADCKNCPALCDPRSQVVHGYGDVGADFLFVGERPDADADRSGTPFVGEGRVLYELLADLGLCPNPDAEEPTVKNVYLTHLTRCRDPDRRPSDAEVTNCEPFLNAEIRMINPEVLVPVGDRSLRELGTEYTTTPAAELDVDAHHATELRGRGFALFPTVEPWDAPPERVTEFGEAFAELLGRDYRQTKGRRGR